MKGGSARSGNGLLGAFHRQSCEPYLSSGFRTGVFFLSIALGRISESPRREISLNNRCEFVPGSETSLEIAFAIAIYSWSGEAESSPRKVDFNFTLPRDSIPLLVDNIRRLLRRFPFRVFVCGYPQHRNSILEVD
jgi:hypothetical protein